MFELIEEAHIVKEPAAKTSRTACGACGRPYATAKQMAKAKSIIKLVENAATLCPACRLRATGSQVERALADCGNRERVRERSAGVVFTVAGAISPEN